MSVVLGIDIGTSTVKVILVDQESDEVIQESSHSLGSKHAEVRDIKGACEQTLENIWTSLETCMKSLDTHKLQQVCAIGVCGQMHGCMLWKDSLQPLTCDFSASTELCSNLITWQDSRCSAEFLSSLPPTQQSIQVSAGYGCATLAWLQKHRPHIIQQFNRAGTIMDFVVWALSSAGKEMGVVMSSQNAAFWGYFDTDKMAWELDL